MRNSNTKLINKTKIETKFIYSQEIKNIFSMTDEEGQTLAFSRTEDGNQIIFTKDTEGVDVAVEHTIDGGKIFHLSQDSKGLPAMHEFRPDGTEVMYLLDANKKLEKSVETKTNGDKVTTWYYANGDVLVQEQRQTDGIVFKLTSNEEKEALVWLHADGSAQSYGDKNLTEKLKLIFAVYLDGAEV